MRDLLRKSSSAIPSRKFHQTLLSAAIKIKESTLVARGILVAGYFRQPLPINRLLTSIFELCALEMINSRNDSESWPCQGQSYTDGSDIDSRSPACHGTLPAFVDAFLDPELNSRISE